MIANVKQLFRGEFIFPADGLDANLDRTLHTLERDQVIKITRGADDSNNMEWIGLSDLEREKGRENFDFYCFLIWPFIEGFWLGAVSLIMLTPPVEASGEVWLDMKKVQDQAQVLGKTLYHQGDLSYFEAVNKETLKNAYQRFEEEGIIIVAKSREAKGVATVRLADEWRPKRDAKTRNLVAQGKLWDFSERISQSRREGKNRRDGATVKTRVVDLVDLVGKQLFDAAAAQREHPSGDFASSKKRRRKIVQPQAKL